MSDSNWLLIEFNRVLGPPKLHSACTEFVIGMRVGYINGALPSGGLHIAGRVD